METKYRFYLKEKLLIPKNFVTDFYDNFLVFEKIFKVKNFKHEDNIKQGYNNFEFIDGKKIIIPEFFEYLSEIEIKKEPYYSVPRVGGLKEIMTKILKEYNGSYLIDIIDLRKVNKLEKQINFREGMALRDYQQKALDFYFNNSYFGHLYKQIGGDHMKSKFQLFKEKHGHLNSVLFDKGTITDGIMVAPAGGGKTVIVSGYIAKNQGKTLIILPNNTLFKQFKQEIADFLTIDINEIGELQGKTVKDILNLSNDDIKKELKPITVAMINSLYLYKKELKLDLRKIFNNYNNVVLDECVTGDTLIQTIDGAKFIGELKEGEEIYTLNEKTKKIEIKKVQKVIKKVRNKELIKIKNNSLFDLKCTFDHEIYQKKSNSFIKAKNINNDELLKFNELEFSHYKEKFKESDFLDALYSMILFDGNILINTNNQNKARFRVNHLSRHTDYLNFKKDILNNFNYGIEKIQFYQNQGYSSNELGRIQTKSREEIQKLHSIFYENKHKKISFNFLKENIKNPDLFFAIAMQDDGSGNQKNLFLRLATNAFGKEGSSNIKQYLEYCYPEMIGEITILKDNRERISEEYKYSIDIKTKGALFLYKKIRRYVLDSMKYKFLKIEEAFNKGFKYGAGNKRECLYCKDIITKNGKGQKFCKDSLCIKSNNLRGEFYENNGIITEKERFNYVKNKNKEYEKYKYVYDLTVEDNHNYFANGILIHNCHQSASKMYTDVLQDVTSKNIYSTTATPSRRDGMMGILNLFNGNKIYEIPKEVLHDNNYLMKPTILPRVLPGYIKANQDFAVLQSQVSESKERAQFIVDDILSEIEHGNPCIVLSNRIEQLEVMNELLIKATGNKFISGMIVGSTKMKEKSKEELFSEYKEKEIKKLKIKKEERTLKIKEKFGKDKKKYGVQINRLGDQYKKRTDKLQIQLDKKKESIFSKPDSRKDVLNKFKLQEKSILNGNVDKKLPIVLFATDKLLGTGFNFPIFNRLFLTQPVSARVDKENPNRDGTAKLIQYVGRVARTFKKLKTNGKYLEKRNAVVYDYVDYEKDISGNLTEGILYSQFKSRYYNVYTLMYKIGRIDKFNAIFNYYTNSEEREGLMEVK